ncbi:MAG: dTDP-4-dehydrorhamnose 3,5-epimerase [Alphaproteobacteria bacterium]|nr:dTDP-4-dehydrorhamnose 3,5-epimerase [Alphaproteobacteria bacterium]MBV9692719.1 dTDP-4-dehydrorhamnose 3,5-epimerase [Alphaproteobacteria bacterium]
MSAPAVQRFSVVGPVLITPKRLSDARGFFSETYSKRSFAEAGIDLDFVQDNHSLSADAGTVRGLHFQEPPFAQDKLVRVTRGRVLDVAVDIRRSSPTYGRHVAVELSAENWHQFLIPKGFAHGFCTLEPDTEVLYKVSAFYSAEHERGIRWHDPAIGIAWPSGAGAVLSARDASLPVFADLVSPFE